MSLLKFRINMFCMHGCILLRTCVCGSVVCKRHSLYVFSVSLNLTFCHVHSFRYWFYNVQAAVLFAELFLILLLF